MSSDRDTRYIGSGTVVALGLLATAVVLLGLGGVVGWDPVWRAFGVTPLQPPFVDMHIINAHAACALKGADAYVPNSCSSTTFNIPPAWLWLGSLGIDDSDSTWLSALFIAVTAVVMVLLFRGRSWSHGVIALGAIASPSVMMGVERGNLDLLILALVGSAALIYQERTVLRACGAVALLFLGVVLKLIPIFCVSVAARFTKQTVLFACAIVALSLVYMGLILKYVFLIRRNVPTTFVMSYGYKSIFLGIDHIRSEAGLSPLGLSDTWLPAATAALVLICAVFVAVSNFRAGRDFCPVDASTAGTAFLFGAGIYCGTYLLGTNYVYRLMFLLLCVPQLLDWQFRKYQGDNRSGIAELGLFGLVMGALWLNGNANGLSIFLLLPQLLNWFLFFFMAVVLLSNFLRTWAESTSVQSPSVDTLHILNRYAQRSPIGQRLGLRYRGVEFIDENGGGPGVRLRKPPKQKR
jgi:hypothetical protein